MSSPESPELLLKHNRPKASTPVKSKRSRRPRKNSDGDLSVDTTTTAELSDNSPVPKARTERKSKSGDKKKKDTKVGKKSQPKDDISDEEKQSYIAIDCEMVGTGMDGLDSVLGRVTLVDWDGQIILDEYVRPDQEITDYRTFVSGIRADNLQTATMDLATIRTVVMQHLHGKTLIGHALKNDLQALNIRHPWQLTRDTAKYEPFMKVRFDDGVLWPRKLKELATEKLSRDIQQPGMPHSPIEDAVTAMDLYKKVRSKWEKVMEYKIKRTAEIEQLQQQHCHPWASSPPTPLR